jgi:putative flippase GtrA
VIAFARFTAVSALGVGVQLATVALLTQAIGMDATPASAAGVTVAVVHNFAWHVRWTWRDRAFRGLRALAALGRFAGANGVVSLAGTMALIPALTVTAHVPVLAANLITIALCGLLNFGLADRVVFRHRSA